MPLILNLFQNSGIVFFVNIVCFYSSNTISSTLSGKSIFIKKITLYQQYTLIAFCHSLHEV